MGEPTGRRARRGSIVTIVVLAIVAASCTGGEPTAAPTPTAPGPVGPGPGGTSPGTIDDPLDLVNPFIGTAPAGVATPVPGGAGGSTWPGAAAPFGAVQFSPDTPGAENETGYLYDATTIEAFSMVHFSGAGCSNNELLQLLPTIAGDATPAPFSHERERARPGRYDVTLDNGIDVALAATTRAGVARFTFPDGADAGLHVDADHRRSRFDNDFTSSLTPVGDRELRGTVGAGAFCGTPTTYDVHVAIELDQPFTVDSLDPEGRAQISFAATPGRPTVVEARIGLSWVDVDGAVANRDAEVGERSLEDAAARTAESWRDLLGRVRIEGGDVAQRRIFTTALYRVFLHPNVDSDVDGRYLGFDGEVHTVPDGRRHYANFSGWDVYRTQMQLLALLAPDEATDIARSLMAMADECGGGLPKWTTWSAETSGMVGDPGPAMLAGLDAFGAEIDDPDHALALMLRSADDAAAQCGYVRVRPGLTPYVERGYTPNVPFDQAQSDLRYALMWQEDLGDVSTSLEYNATDAAIAAFASRHGDDEVAARLARRGASWETLFDPAVGYVRPRLSDGSFHEPFDATSPYGFTEGNAAQYTWMVPQSYGRLVDLLGRDEAIRRLDSMFSQLNAGLDQPHFYIGNEPMFSSPWAYLWAGAPERTQAVVRRVLDKEFADTPGGLPGNDDLGAMSAWYVWAAIGLFPVVPGDDLLAVHLPRFATTTIAVPGRPEITITVDDGDGDGRSPAAVDDVITGARLGSQPLDRAWLRVDELVDAGSLTVDLGPSPSGWASSDAARPPSLPAHG